MNDYDVQLTPPLPHTITAVTRLRKEEGKHNEPDGLILEA
jgi:hypothetical protein